MLAELSVRECGHLSLDQSIRVAAFVALHDRDRGKRYARRWLTWFIAQRPAATLDEETMVCSVFCVRLAGPRTPTRSSLSCPDPDTPLLGG